MAGNQSPASLQDTGAGLACSAQDREDGSRWVLLLCCGVGSRDQLVGLQTDRVILAYELIPAQPGDELSLLIPHSAG